jgi:hypothetical protein
LKKKFIEQKSILQYTAKPTYQYSRRGTLSAGFDVVSDVTTFGTYAYFTKMKPTNQNLNTLVLVFLET